MVMNETLFQRWTHDVLTTTRAQTYPDGCRDVLIIRRPDAHPEVRLTPFDLRPRLVVLTAGTALQGFRLRPGATISTRSLKAIEAAPDKAETIIRRDLELSDDVGHAIRALTQPGTRVADSARDVGL